MTDASDGSPASLSVERVEEISALLEEIVEDRGLLAGLPEPVRRRFLVAAGRVSRPTKDEMRKLHRAWRKLKKAARKKGEMSRILNGRNAWRADPVPLPWNSASTIPCAKCS